MLILYKKQIHSYLILAFSFLLVLNQYLGCNKNNINENYYYVDSNTKIEKSKRDGSLKKPWKYIEEVNSHTFFYGDVIHFKRGAIWYEETLNLKVDKTTYIKDKYIKVTSYYDKDTGSDNLLKPLPLIKSATVINEHWEKHSENTDIWKAKFIMNNLPKAKIISIDDKVFFNEVSSYNELSKKEQSFYIDKLNQKIFIRLNENPNHHTLYISNQLYGIISNIDYVIYENIELSNSSSGIVLSSNENNQLLNLIISDTPWLGVWVINKKNKKSGNHIIKNCKIQNTGIKSPNNGTGSAIKIDNSKNGRFIENIKIKNNVINSSSLGELDHGIYDKGDGTLYEDNLIENCTGSGIKIKNLSNNKKSFTISNNKIFNCEEAGVLIQGFVDVNINKNIIVNSGFSKDFRSPKAAIWWLPYNQNQEIDISCNIIDNCPALLRIQNNNLEGLKISNNQYIDLNENNLVKVVNLKNKNGFLDYDYLKKELKDNSNIKIKKRTSFKNYQLKKIDKDDYKFNSLCE